MNNKKVVYIAGKVRGLSNYKEKFAAAKKKLEDQGYAECQFKEVIFEVA